MNTAKPLFNHQDMDAAMIRQEAATKAIMLRRVHDAADELRDLHHLPAVQLFIERLARLAQ